MPAIFAHPPFLAYYDSLNQPKDLRLEAIARVAPLVVQAALLGPSNSFSPTVLPAVFEYWVHLEDYHTIEHATSYLDNGASKIITKDTSFVTVIPKERILLEIDSNTSTLLSDSHLLDNIAGLLVVLPELEPMQILASFREVLGGKASKDSKLLFFQQLSRPSISDSKSLVGSELGRNNHGGLPCLSVSLLNPSTISHLFTSALQTDRTDGLFATLVTSNSQDPLGLVYSSSASLAMSIETGQATYFSRSRNSLWKKGETSGATQRVVTIRKDCDADALQFEVEQKAGTGFCQQA